MPTPPSSKPSEPILQRFRLDGRVALVTGASSGLGVAFALALAQAGADLVLIARRADRLEQTRELIETAGRRAVAVIADVSCDESAERIVNAATAALGGLDILVNNAGISDYGPAHREPQELFDEVIDLNLRASFRLSAACARVMSPGSSIVNVASVLGLTTVPGVPCAGYGASKAGLLGLTRHLASQWTPHKGIRVNALVPGFVRTEASAAFPEELIEQRLLAGRWGEAEEIAAGLVYLASPASAYMTGAQLVVDGGLTVA